MGIFSGLIGNASQMDTDKVENQLSDILIPDEQVDLAYTLIRDLIVFTNYRLILSLSIILCKHSSKADIV
ncbi:PH domain-containing protein, partial [Streptococcus agalactiae]|uniref:PH domain-containing protein n=1 Tax=Streptococcus agalactiae TaxID=1311 RepID=UPI000A961A1C